MTTQHHHLITKILAGAAIAVGLCVAGAAAASADPNADCTDPDPFGGLSCSQDTAPPPALRAEEDQGIREGHSASLPGLPAPAQPSQPRP